MEHTLCKPSSSCLPGRYLHNTATPIASTHRSDSILVKWCGLEPQPVNRGIYIEASNVNHGFWLRRYRFRTLDVPGATEPSPTTTIKERMPEITLTKTTRLTVSCGHRKGQRQQHPRECSRGTWPSGGSRRF